jgi:hypothetical protein
LTTRQKPTTAAEFLEQLNSDPEWVARQRRMGLEFAEQKERYQFEEAPLIKELEQVGITIKSVYDLDARQERYPAAVPLLLNHLFLPPSDAIRDGIARALATNDAIPAHETLRDEYIKCSREDTSSKSERRFTQGLALATAATTTEANISELINLVEDNSLGDDRILLLARLRKSKSTAAAEALERLTHHPTFAKEIGAWRNKRSHDGN